MNSTKDIKKEQVIELINGNPVPTVVNVVLTPRDIKNKAFLVLSEEVEYEGKVMTRGEKVIRKLVETAETGRLDAIGEVLDRTMGKPLQQNVNLNGELTYDDFLNMLGISPDKELNESSSSSSSSSKEIIVNTGNKLENVSKEITNAVDKFLRIK